jgi:hypothetical protein
VVIGLAASGSSLRNRFVQDDLPLILVNETVHSLRSPWRFVTEPYWNDPFPAALYRPLATATHAVQWKLGAGGPEAFRLMSIVLLIASGLALFALATLLLPRILAWSAAALFLAHPVHVEATALAVNQGELAVGALLCLATALYIRSRLRGGLEPGTVAGIAVCYLAASLYKENGLVLPGLLLAAELTVIPDARSARERLKVLRPLYLLLALIGLLTLLARTAVLGGETIGTPTAEALAGARTAWRAMTMMGVVPHWLRLLFWPAELQADYGPNEIAGGMRWGFLHWAGLVILTAWTAGVILWRRTQPVLAFGLLWIAVALFPVSNVLVPTGVILAERTLFLATAGATLFIAGLMPAVRRDASQSAAGLVRLAWAGVAVVVVLGVARSWQRGGVWRDQETLLRQTVVDSPRSYSAHLALARLLSDSGAVGEAEPHFREAAMIQPTLVDRERIAGDRYRMEGYCRPAIRRYRLPLLLRPRDSALRASVVACLINLGRYSEVRAIAEPGLEDPAAHHFFRRAIHTADSALAAAQ